MISEIDSPTVIPLEQYRSHKYLLQVELLKWQNYVKQSGSKHIIIFEGRDTAGKSSTIKRFTEHLHPRGSRVVALYKPTEEERGEWYFQRYIRQFPRSGEITWWDRSYYNRAGVEPIMGFCTPEQVNQFYQECPKLEKIWIQSGIQIIKFWFSVTREEQARRFEQRLADPLKLGKLSEVDQVSRTLWDEYTKCKKRMISHTSIKEAPWITVKSDDKPAARLAAMQYVLLKNDYPERDLTAIGRIDPEILSVKD